MAYHFSYYCCYSRCYCCCCRRSVKKLHLEKLDAGCSLVDQLPKVLYYWNRLTDLRYVAPGYC